MDQQRKRARIDIAAGLAISVLALALFGWLSQNVAAGQVFAFDSGVRTAVHQFASPPLTQVMLFFTDLGTPVSLTVLGAGLVIALVSMKWTRAALLFLITMAGAFVLDATLKLAFHRTRPVSFFGYPEPRSYSFPSGHALFSICFFGFVAALISARAQRRIWRIVAWIAAAIFAVGIGLSRIYLGVHYPSDVLAGYAAAVVWVSAIFHANKLLKARRNRKEAAPASVRAGTR